jgi:hypothetical protein
MMNDDTMISMGVFFIAAAVFWIIALINAPVLTLILTFAAILFAGFFSTSGRGDGREGR